MIVHVLLYLSLILQHTLLLYARMPRMVPCIDLTSELGQCGICWSELTVDHDSLVPVFLFDRCQCVSCHPRLDPSTLIIIGGVWPVRRAAQGYAATLLPLPRPFQERSSKNASSA
jgi:hypothetical protein